MLRIHCPIVMYTSHTQCCSCYVTQRDAVPPGRLKYHKSPARAAQLDTQRDAVARRKQYRSTVYQGRRVEIVIGGGLTDPWAPGTWAERGAWAYNRSLGQNPPSSWKLCKAPTKTSKRKRRTGENHYLISFCNLHSLNKVVLQFGSYSAISVIVNGFAVLVGPPVHTLSGGASAPPLRPCRVRTVYATGWLSMPVWGRWAGKQGPL